MNITVNSKKGLGDIEVMAKNIVVNNKVQKSQVVAVFDVSGSMEDMYNKGIVKALATRVLAMGLQLDDNGSIPVYALDSDCRSVGEITKDNLDTFVDDNLVDLVGGGTSYAPTINKIIADAENGDPMFVLLFTDGENWDKGDAEKALIRASQLPIFFQWYGIYEGKSSPRFDFLHSMDEMDGRTVDNAGFSPLGLGIVHVENEGDDSQALMEDMVKEYKDFPKKATDAGATWGNLNEVHKAMKGHSGLLGFFGL